MSREAQQLEHMTPLENWQQDVNIEVSTLEQPVESLDESLAHQRNLLFIKDTKEVTTSKV